MRYKEKRFEVTISCQHDGAHICRAQCVRPVLCVRVPEEGCKPFCCLPALAHLYTYHVASWPRVACTKLRFTIVHDTKTKKKRNNRNNNKKDNNNISEVIHRFGLSLSFCEATIHLFATPQPCSFSHFSPPSCSQQLSLVFHV